MAHLDQGISHEGTIVSMVVIEVTYVSIHLEDALIDSNTYGNYITYFDKNKWLVAKHVFVKNVFQVLKLGIILYALKTK